MKLSYGLCVTGLAVYLAARIATTPAWATPGENIESVHFDNMEPAFGTVPRRALLWADRDSRITRGNGGEGGSWESGQLGVELPQAYDSAGKRVTAWKTVRRAAERAVAEGRWRQATRLFTREAEAFGWTGELRDRVQTLAVPSALDHPQGLKRYFAALALLDETSLWSNALPAPDTAVEPHDGYHRLLRFSPDDAGSAEPARLERAKPAFLKLVQDRSLPADLRGRALYQLAACEAAFGSYAVARERYHTLLETFPGVRTQATLLMLARAALLPPVAWDRETEEGGRIVARLLEMPLPHRYRTAAEGLRARYLWLTGRSREAINLYIQLGDSSSIERVLAAPPPKQVPLDQIHAELLAGYLRQLEAARDEWQFARAAYGVQRALPLVTHRAAHLFIRRLLSDPDVAAPYFYFRLYHTDVDTTDLADLADRFARVQGERGVRRLPRLICARLAEVYYQNDQLDRAALWAERAADLSSGLAELPGRDRALYVQGAIARKQHRLAASRAAFTEILTRYPQSGLTLGAREEIAITAEMQGDLDTALEQYFTLHYNADIAFFLDARMTTAQVRSFFERHPHLPYRNLFRYTLGIRYLRDNRLAEARRWLRQVPHPIYDAWSAGRGDNDFDKGSPDPQTVANQLAGLQEAMDSVSDRSRAVRAAAAYRYASYFYTHGSLLFYNSALWQGNRAWSFTNFWNADIARQIPADSLARERHVYEHENYFRASRLCQEVARRYPNTPSAPLALYRAACAENRLRQFDAGRFDPTPYHSLMAAHLMMQVCRLYPHHPLAPVARKYSWVFYTEHLGQMEEKQEQEREKKRQEQQARAVATASPA